MCSSQLLHLVFCLRNGNLQDYCVTVQCHKNANLRSSNLDLAPSSELRYLGRSASRQSSLPINRDCQQTATNYLLYQSRAYTEHHIFFAFHKLLKRYIKVQQLVQCMVPRALFGGVWNTSKSVYSSDSQLLLSRPSVSGAYLKKYTRKSTTRSISYTVSSA